MMRKAQDLFFRQARKEYSEKQRMLILVPAAVLFLFLLPRAIIRGGNRLDQRMGIPRAGFHPANGVAGALISLSGWLIAMWSIYSQLTIGRGTPIPLVATQKLIVQPPFSYCRNPMALGTILAYLGIALAAGSLGSALLVAAGTSLLLVYILRVEEKEMVARFGEEYLEYRRRTPFLFPRFRG